MRRLVLRVLAVAFIVQNIPEIALPPDYPDTRRQPVVDIIHGREVADPYRWLEDADDPEVREWMAAQNAYARRHLDDLPGRDALRTRLHELSFIDSVSSPVRRGDRLFYWRRHGEQDKAVYYVSEPDDRADPTIREGERSAAEAPGGRGNPVERTRRTSGPVERVLIDPNRMSEDGGVSVTEAFPSRDGTLVAYKRRENNADAAALHLLDVDTGAEREVIPAAMMAYPSWTPDSRGFYYVGLPDDPTIPPDRLVGHAVVRYHRIGDDPADDPVIAGSTGDASVYQGATLSWDGRYLFVQRHRGWTASDIFFRRVDRHPPAIGTSSGKAAMRADADVDAESSIPGFRTLIAGREAMYSVDAWQHRFYVRTNEGASRYRVFRVDVGAPERARWEEIVAETGATLEDASIVGGHLVLSYLRDAHSEVAIHDTDGQRLRAVELPAMGTTTGLIGAPDDDTAYFSFSSFVIAREIYRTRVSTGETELWRRVEVPVDPSAFVVEQVRYPSKDGTEITMFVVRGEDFRPTGDHPTLLTGYGGFSVSLTPSFSTRAALWVEQGGVYAVANLRGGGEYGEDWHRAGMRENKQNVFDDFIAAAEHLIDSGYTRPDRLAIVGGSNGGLLVGATMVQRPDLMAAVVCSVPLLDMIRYHLFGRGRLWIPEYGSADDADEFATLIAYSPYHDAQDDVAYPAFLMLSADSDDRVDPMHARKFTALLQANRTSTRPVILRIEDNAGHGGADSIRKAIERDTDAYAFLLEHLGATSR